MKKRIFFIGYALVMLLALAFVVLAIFTDDRTYLYVGLPGLILANVLNLIKDTDDRRKK